MSKIGEKKSTGASDGTKFSGAKEPLVNYPVSVFCSLPLTSDFEKSKRTEILERSNAEDSA